MKDLIKYQHYLIFTLSAIVFLYVLEPLYSEIKDQQSSIFLMEKRLNKTTAVIENQEEFAKQLALKKEIESEIKPLIFSYETEAKFKLEAQQQIEKVINDANCKIESTSWDGVINLQQIDSWKMSVRFKGNPSCLLKVTRGVESMEPLVSIIEYRFSGRRINENVRTQVTGILELKLLHREKRG